MSTSISLVPMIGKLYRELGITDIISEDQLNIGLAQLEAELVAIAVDVNVAVTRGVPLRHAVLDDVNYPHLHRAHATIDDVLEMSLPAEFQAWVRRVHAMPMPPLVDELRTQLAQLAAANNSAVAFAVRFLLFQAARANLKVAAWRTNGAFEAVGATPGLIDEVAEAEVDELLDLVSALPPDIRPFHQLVSKAMVELTDVVEELRRMLCVTNAELVAQLTERASIECNLRMIDPVEAALIRNELHEVLGEQYLSIEGLQRAHPALLGSSSRAALDQRASRLRQRLKERGRAGAPRRHEPSLYQLLTSLDGEMP